MVGTLQREPGILRRPYALPTIGSWSLVFLAAFESLAVTTIMPIVTADLDGRALYSVAFSAALAAGVIGMVMFGSWADRVGPARPLLTAIGLFGAGLVLAGSASTMTVFVGGRFLQGLGAGGITVALYVLVAKMYPPVLHIRIFGAFATAWVLPSMIGPFAAGLVADAWGWHWVFLGVLVLVAAATAMIVPALREHHTRTGPGPAEPSDTSAGPDLVESSGTSAGPDLVEPPGPRATGSERTGGGRSAGRRTGAAVVVATAVVALGYAVELDGGLAWLVAPAVLGVVAYAARGLLPAGTYRAKPGLPAAVLLCGVAGAVFYGTEVYLPLLLQERYGLPAWLAGVTLTAAAVAWALASALQGRLGDRLSPRRAVTAGAVVLAAGAVTELVTVALMLPAAVVTAGWFLAGAGMGTLYPRMGTLVLAYSEPGREGFNTSAKSITDAVGGSVALALAGLIFGALGAASTRAPYLGVMAFTSVIGLSAVLLARRVG
ncbi:MFS transporter [Jidongwangia harbinensis]|uniref:MFS transporter n=1 Tax=Jidongwangia harbinensis TaxID=2878561 RepID=UPI001CD99BE2|nr:MFS transporter [Jidongwangia harbinensis]MCA2218669.1 MFS transporter [Jidongwangia harbinensis]